jgi:hypothetical protein
VTTTQPHAGSRERGQGRRRQRRATQARRGAVALLGVGAALAAAAWAPTGPGSRPADVFTRAAVAGAVTVLSTRSRPTAWIVAGLLVAVSVHPAPALAAVAGAVVTLGAVMAIARRPATPVLGAAVGAATSLAALHAPGWGPYGTTALLAAGALVVLVGSGIAHHRPPARRRLTLAALAVGAVLTIGIGAFAVSVAQAKPEAEAGAAAARAGLDAAQAGKARRAEARFEAARRHLVRAGRHLDAPWARPARILPGLSAQDRALRRLVDEAVGLAAVGARTARAGDLSRIRAVDGRIDPAVLSDLTGPLRELRTSLVTTVRDLDRLDTGWLAPQLRNARDELRRGLTDATDDVDRALLATETAPRLLGADAPKRYFVMFTTPTETRGGSGFLGNYGILTADDGRLDLTEFGRNSDLNAGGNPAQRTLTGLDEYLTRYRAARPTREWRDINFTPDFPTVAEVVRQLYPQSGGTPIDGVLAVDPRALSALLTLTGPVSVNGLDEPLTAENATRILLRDQYTEFPAIDARTDFLGDTARAVTDRLTGATLPGPRALGALLGPEIARKHLLFTTFDESGNALLDQFGTRGGFGPFPGDALALVTQNLGGNKIDQFLHRSLDVRTTLDPATGTQRSSVTVRLRNDAPESGLPLYVIGNRWRRPPGTNMLVVSLYSPLSLESATIDGQPVVLTTGREVFGVFPVNLAPNAVGGGPVTFTTGQELGLEVFTGDLEIPAGATRELRFELAGAARLLSGRTPPRYRLDLWQQPMVNADQVTVSVMSTSPWTLANPAGGFTARDGDASFAAPVRRDRVLTADLDGPPIPQP